MRVTWSEAFNTGQIANENQMEDIKVKPDVGFPYDGLVLDESNNFKIIDGARSELTPEEYQQCETFVETYIFPPIEVPMVDDLGIYLGIKPITELGDATIPGSLPPDELHVWTQSGWHRVTMAIYGTGYYVEAPGDLSGDIVKVVTELDLMPVAERPTDLWDFVKECWYDNRDLYKEKRNAVLELRNLYEALNIRFAGEYTTHYEMATWRIQHEEAVTWLSNNTHPTPFIDTLNATRTDDLTKAALVEKIMLKVNKWKIGAAKLLGGQQNLERKVMACETLTDLDVIRKEDIETLV